MENVAVNMANSLSSPVRAAIETMLGRALLDDEQVSILALRPHSAPTGEHRIVAAKRLKAAMDALETKAASAVPSDLDAAFDEAMAAVRPDRR